MSSSPGQYNFSVKRRADHSFELEFVNPDSTPMSLVGYEVDAEIWDQSRTTKYANFTITYLDREAGRVRLSLSDTMTTELPIISYYDVLLIDPSEHREYYLEGVISTTEGLTT